MIGFLRRLFGGQEDSARRHSAPLSNSLLLVVGRYQPPGATLRDSRSFGRVKVSVWEQSADRDAATGGGAPSVLPDLLAGVTTRLDTAERSDLFDWLFSTVSADLDKPGANALAKSLHQLRQRLRPRRPGLTFESGEPVVIDSIALVDERSFWVVGWCGGGNDMLERIELITPEGQRAGNLDGAYRYPRPDVAENWAATGVHETEKHGFIKYLELEAPSRLSEGWIIELRRRTGQQLEGPMPPATLDPIVTRGMILVEATAARVDSEELRLAHARPALERLQRHLNRSVEIDSIVQHGEPPEAPSVSIVVPLYTRIDLVEHQFTQFWSDPDFADAELIYVLDTPELAPALSELVAELHELYGLPVKVLTLNRNGGYAIANNRGVSQARGRLVLLLNSDVIPAEPGWIGRMRDFYDATPGIGALGPKLLFEDDSIQHAGMYFQRDPATGIWWNQHYHKGFSRTLAPANVSRPVPAVTAACMMIERELYEQVGGFSDLYVQGGFEDSDLCLRVLDAGRENWYIAGVELYHLEAQSFPIHLRATNPYNGWLQAHLWDARIREVMAAQKEAEGAPLAVG
jgi:O-antigen biosynthesis protein